jgi:hypothetical protein
MATPFAKEEQYTVIQFLLGEDVIGCILPQWSMYGLIDVLKNCWTSTTDKEWSGGEYSIRKFGWKDMNIILAGGKFLRVILDLTILQKVWWTWHPFSDWFS